MKKKFRVTEIEESKNVNKIWKEIIGGYYEIIY